MGKYKHTLKESLYTYSIELKDVYFSNNWLMVCNGFITIKSGYSWDGCTFAPDTIKTHIASCVHDACYQFKINRFKSDRCFYDLLKQNKFPFAKIYYISVRLFGFLFY